MVNGPSSGMTPSRLRRRSRRTFHRFIGAKACSTRARTLWWTINGQPRTRIAAFPLPDGTLTAFRHDIDAAVETLAATNTTLYADGIFTTVDGTPRQHLAAFTTSTGALTAWAPAADRRVLPTASARSAPTPPALAPTVSIPRSVKTALCHSVSTLRGEAHRRP